MLSSPSHHGRAENIHWEATEPNLPRESWGNWGSLVWEEVGVPSRFLPGRQRAPGGRGVSNPGCTLASPGQLWINVSLGPAQSRMSLVGAGHGQQEFLQAPR